MQTIQRELQVLLSDMVDNSDLLFERKLYLFPDGFITGDVPMRGHTIDNRPSQAPVGVRWPPISHSQAAPSAGAGAGGAMPTDPGPSTDDSSGRQPWPGFAGGSTVAGAFHHGRSGGPTPAEATHVAARSDSRPATTPDGPEAAAPPATSTRSGG